jgi:alpha,alpha-trehalose-phosphate synthase [UDP-forming]/trehalose-phosphatase
MREMLKTVIDGNFSDKNLIVVSNREPYTHKKSGLSIRAEKPAGGLTSAMDDVLKVTGGTWVAWGNGSRDRDVVDGKNCVHVPPENPSYILKRVWLAASEVENYYHGYSNQVLWPLCHITLDRVYFRKKFWEDYKKINRYFADAVIEEAGGNSIVWIHDYHLCLVPEMLRNERPELTIAHFWHIPWPDWSVFRICPQAREIIEGLFGNDIIGFQTPLFVKNFMDCVKECLDAEVDYSRAVVVYNGRTTRLKAFPISVDYDRFDSVAASKNTDAAIKKIKEHLGITDEYIGIGVDRLEYTKALIKRLQAINFFFERYERFRRKLVFIQIAVPTRMKEPYISYKKSVEDLVARINERYSIGSWKPIIYIDTKIEHKELAAYYKMADFSIISSVYDGMNLVAKEYIASKTDEKGVLILSEFAGASEELEGSILVNPYDIEEFSECIKTALKMPDKEKVSRMAALRRQVSENNIHKWILDILNEIAAVSAVNSERCCYLFDSMDEVKKKAFHKDVFMFLDYDGTLTPIVGTPDKAVISDEMRSLMIKLKDIIPVAVISGRALKDVKSRVGIDDIVYAGNHGAEIWDGKNEIISQGSEGNRRLLEEVLEKLKKETSHIKGVLIEDKGITASLHFRNVNVPQVGDVFGIFEKTAKEYEDNFRFIIGKKVFEIRPVNMWNKGDAVSWIIENMGRRRFPVYIGDDTTDEDAYGVLKNKGLSVSIGGSVNADYYIQNQGEVKDFLEMLCEVLNK